MQFYCIVFNCMCTQNRPLSTGNKTVNKNILHKDGQSQGFPCPRDMYALSIIMNVFERVLLNVVKRARVIHC